jgi:uncharacterized repeat protein (TIGR02543 family)
MIGEHEMKNHTASRPVQLTTKLVLICVCIVLLASVLPLPASAVTNYKWEKWSCNMTPASYTYSISLIGSGMWYSANGSIPGSNTYYSGYSISNGGLVYINGSTFSDAYTAWQSGFRYFGTATFMYEMAYDGFGPPYGLVMDYGMYGVTATPATYNYSKGSTLSGYEYGTSGAYPSNDKQLDTTTNTYYWYVLAGEAAAGTPMFKWEKWNCITNYTYAITPQGSSNCAYPPWPITYYRGYSLSNGAIVYTDGFTTTNPQQAFSGGYKYYGATSSMTEITGFTTYYPNIPAMNYNYYVVTSTPSSYSKGATQSGYVYGTSSAYPLNDKQMDTATSTYYWYVFAGESVSTVSFNSNGGSSTISQSIFNGSKATQPATPTKTGYTFAGWYKDSGLTTQWNFATDTVDGSNFNLYAKWAPNSYTISFNTNGGSAISNVTQNYNTTIASAPSTTQTGYTFCGWYSDVGLTTAVSFPYTILANATLYAKWNINSYTINFNSNGGTAVANIIQSYNTTIPSALSTTKTGYTFAGWYSDAGLTTAVSFPYTMLANATLYAKWSINSYTISFNANGGTAVPNITQNYNSIIASTPSTTRTGYTFAGWYSDSGLTATVSFPYTIVTDATLYAKWNIGSSYTIDFNVNGGTAVSSITQNYNTTITSAPSTTKTGCTFGGWYSDAGLSTAVSFPYTIITNATLYAKWNSSNSYTINFNTNGGTAASSVTQNSGTTIATAPATTKTGYTFSGWYSDAGLTTAVNFPYTITTNAILYAKWNIISYTVSFNTNGGSAVTSITQNYNTTIATSPSTTKTGYTFGGWCSDAGLTTIVSFPYTITANATLYAKWTSANTAQTLSITNGNTYLVNVNVENVTTFTGVTYTITYDSTKLQISDLCTFTYQKETVTGAIAGTGITITGASSGIITFTVDKSIPSGSKWTGVLNILEFKALTTGSTNINIH